MSKIIKTKIDGVPVTLEILAVGPAEKAEIEKLSENLAKEEREAAKDPVKLPDNTKFRVLEVGDKDNPATEEQKKKVEEKVKEQDAAELIGDLIENINSMPPEKDWYQSKTIWANIIAIIGIIAAYFGINIEELGIGAEEAMTISTLVISILNLYLRKTTTSKVRFKK